MSGALWRHEWFDSAAPAKRELWRGVEAQHVVSTLRLVDDLEEQALLEALLEDSKPPLPPEAAGVHWLLAAAFRYSSPNPSRFRRADRPGIWYGAEDRETVARELGHWRWRHFMDSDGLREGELVTEHTFFLARFKGVELDLTVEPWRKRRANWRSPQHYEACQRLAQHVQAEHPGVAGIRYESARHDGGMCAAVFHPHALTLTRPLVQETWTSKTTARVVLFSHGRDAVEICPA